MEVLLLPPTSFPHLRDKCSICSFPERLRRARHAYACSSMTCHATNESIPKLCLGSQYQGSLSKFNMLIRMPVETNHAQACSFTATMSQSLCTAIYAGLDLRMNIRCRLSGSGPWDLLVIVVFRLLCHYAPLFTNGVRHLLCKLRESQTLACEVNTCQTSIHKRCAHHGINKSELPRFVEVVPNRGAEK